MTVGRLLRAGWSWVLLLALSALACNFNRSASGTPDAPAPQPGSLATAAAATVAAELTRVGSEGSLTPPAPTPSPAGTTAPETGTPTAPGSTPTPGTPSACGEVLPPRLAVDQTARVVVFQVNLRSTPGLSGSPLTQLARDREILVVDGPVCADGLWWWEVFSEELVTKGWVAEADEADYFLAP